MSQILCTYAPILQDVGLIGWVEAVGSVCESHESNIISDLLFFSILVL